MVYAFEKLQVWQESRYLITSVYKLLDKYPAVERYALCDQIRRASVSVASNIAEGSSRTSDKEKAHFIEIAYGSLMEIYCQLQLSCDLQYIDQQEFDSLKNNIDKIAKMLTSLRFFFLNGTNNTNK